jgi:predicted ATPase
MKKINWLWRGWLARGKFHLLAGSKGAGKSTLLLRLCCGGWCGRSNSGLKLISRANRGSGAALWPLFLTACYITVLRGIKVHLPFTKMSLTIP